MNSAVICLRKGALRICFSYGHATGCAIFSDINTTHSGYFRLKKSNEMQQ